MATDWKDVGQVLLGSWPSQVAGWGREAIAAYVAELKDRGLTPDQAVVALRSCEGAFPPAAGEVVGLVRVDPDRPTFDEAYALIFGARGLLKAHVLGRERPVVHPLVEGFVLRYGADRLAALPVDEPTWGPKHRKDVEHAWNVHVEALDGRQVAQIAGGGLRRLGPGLLGLDGGEAA